MAITNSIALAEAYLPLLDEVDKLEKSWKEGRANGVKTRKRYMTVSNAKKPKSVESTADYRMQWQADVQPGDIFAPLP